MVYVTPHGCFVQNKFRPLFFSRASRLCEWYYLEWGWHDDFVLGAGKGGNGGDGGIIYQQSSTIQAGKDNTGKSFRLLLTLPARSGELLGLLIGMFTP